MSRGALLDLKSQRVACPVCGERVRRIDRNHALSHGYTSLGEFKQAHGIEYATLAQRSRQKFEHLYNIDPHRWVTYYWNGEEVKPARKTYVPDIASLDEKPRSASKFPLNDTTFDRHMDGSVPLAVFAKGTHSRYFGFDVDSKGQAPDHVKQIVQTLVQEGIDRKDIHVSFSGGKGYHVELFTDKHLQTAKWAEFGQYILAQCGLLHEEVEFRPEARNGRAWKLPLTFHHKTDAFAAYCDNQTLELLDVAESHDYLFSITQMSLDVIFAVMKRVGERKHEVQAQVDELAARREKKAREARQAVKIVDERLFRSPEDKAKTAQRYLTEGLPRTGTRWNGQREVMLFLKHRQGIDDTDQMREIMSDWLQRQVSERRVSTTYDEAMRDVDAQLEWVAKTDGYHTQVREITITAAEVEWVLSPPNRCAREFLWALMLYSKVYGKRDGKFFASERHINKILPIDRKTMRKWRDWLEVEGYIWTDMPQGDDEAAQKERARRTAAREAVTYRLNFTPPETSEVVEEVTFEEDADCRSLLHSIAARLYDDKRLRQLKIKAA